MIAQYVDAEAVVVEWTLTTAVVPLITRSGGGVNLFRAMPVGAPLPALIVSRVGGGPRTRSDVPEDVARMSYQCWAAKRSDAAAIAVAVVSACDSLSQLGGFVAANGARLVAAEVLTWFWSPDPESDTPRFVVDALFSTVPAS